MVWIVVEVVGGDDDALTHKKNSTDRSYYSHLFPPRQRSDHCVTASSPVCIRISNESLGWHGILEMLSV